MWQPCSTLFHRLLVGIFLCLLASSCAERQVTTRDVPPALEGKTVGLKRVENAHYAIMPGDEIEIKLTYHPQYNERLEVLPDGTLFLPIVKVVQAAGKTPLELAQELRILYSRELKGPEVVVMLRSSKGRLVYIGGAVRSPQALPLAFPTTLLQAVIRCGGVLTSAHEETVLVLRSSPGEAPQAITVDLDAIRQGRSPDLTLEPYDIVYVPKTVIAKVGEFIDAYLNSIIPKSVTFPFTYEFHSDVRLK